MTQVISIKDFLYFRIAQEELKQPIKQLYCISKIFSVFLIRVLE